MQYFSLIFLKRQMVPLLEDCIVMRKVFILSYRGNYRYYTHICTVASKLLEGKPQLGELARRRSLSQN
jgi:hypothetical protein